MKDWLEEFVRYSTYGESAPRLMYWVGVSTIASALRRKVWFKQGDSQWSPNFYILVIGPPGTVRKSTSIGVGESLLMEVGGINFCATTTSWQAMIQYIAENCRSLHPLPNGEMFESSNMTVIVSELGTFFRPDDGDMVDQLTDLWDCKLGTISKATKTSGTDEMINPWINLMAGTTPVWFAKNFSSELVGGGLASRFVYLYENMPEGDVPYPDDVMPLDRGEHREALIAQLCQYAQYSGPMALTPEAKAWGCEWYYASRTKLRAMDSAGLEYGFLVRQQVHLHKLAMIIGVSRGEFPLIGLRSMQDAWAQLQALDKDINKVFGVVGQNRITQASREIVEVVSVKGSYPRRKLYRDRFFRTMTIGEFDEAVRSAIQAELIYESDGAAFPILHKRK